MVDSLGDTLAQVETDLHCDILGHVQKKALRNTLTVELEKVKAKHLAETQVMWRLRQTLGDSLSNVNAHVLADTMADLLPKAKA